MTFAGSLCSTTRYGSKHISTSIYVNDEVHYRWTALFKGKGYIGAPGAYVTAPQLKRKAYSQDIHDLFAALIVQIPLDTHRYLFRNYPNTFTSEDAIQALGSLRFSYTARTPDPNDPTKLLRTTTTTTFNMEKDMAKALCQQFQQCRLTESATDPQNRSFRDKGIWQVTPKGLCVLQDFCVRTEADMTQLRNHFGNFEPVQLVRLERHPDDDQLVFGRQNLSIVFHIMMTSLPLDGETSGTNNNHSTKATSSIGGGGGHPSSSSASSQSSGSSTTGTFATAPFAMASQISGNDSRVRLLANNLLIHSKKSNRTKPRSTKHIRTVFSAQLCCDWLTDYSTVSSRDEAEQLASEFLKYGWIEFQDSKQSGPIRASKNIMLVLTAKGKEVVAEFEQPPPTEKSTRQTTAQQQQEDETTLQEILSQGPENNEPRTRSRETSHGSSRPPSTALDSSSSSDQDPKESNAARLKVILDDPQLRSLFKDFLRANFCEENLDFWIDYSTLRRKCRSQTPAMPSQNQKDLLEDAYDIWSTYLAPGAQCELNVEHSLRQEMARLVQSMVQIIPTFAPGQVKPTIVISTPSTSQSLRMMLKWFDRVNDHICRLMASDSVPKFVKTPGYRKIQESREKQQQRQLITSSGPDSAPAAAAARGSDNSSNSNNDKDIFYGASSTSSTSPSIVENQA